MKFEPGQHIHLVGIGGSGMSAIARILLEQGYTVSGSDRGANDLTEALSRDGATVYKGHEAAYTAGADMLLITSAVKDDHVEVAAARAAGIPVYKRQDVMSALMEGKKVIAVAGTKGKTTTTSMIVHILRECGQDPSYIVGGVLGNTGTNAGVGKGEWFVVEADEYDNMFLGLKPDIAVITNIEWDHPDFFKTPDDMVESFRKFVHLLDEKNPVGGLLACADDPITREFGEARWNDFRPVSTYGLHEAARFRAKNIRVESKVTFFGIGYKDIGDAVVQNLQIMLPGIHNIQNALGAMLAVENAMNMGSRDNGKLVSDCTKLALLSFKPTARRFDLRADVGEVAVIDDYAHNPMSIRATLDAARQRYPDRELWAVWQPHTYSRTQALFDDFVKSFDAADHVLITDIYAARENPIPGVNSEGVVAAINRRMLNDSSLPLSVHGEGAGGRGSARHTPTFADAVAILRAEVKSPAVILIMSAGDAPQIGIDYLKSLQGEGA
ncbi:MAG: UDP-N-acetylmuramate--L-alanine ligase [Chloroflexota bacterium]